MRPCHGSIVLVTCNAILELLFLHRALGEVIEECWSICGELGGCLSALARVWACPGYGRTVCSTIVQYAVPLCECNGTLV